MVKFILSTLSDTWNLGAPGITFLRQYILSLPTISNALLKDMSSFFY